MHLRTILPATVIAAVAVAGAAGDATASEPSNFSATVACDASTSQAKITFTDVDPTSTKVFITVDVHGTSTVLAHAAIIPNAGLGNSIGVEVPWTPNGQWDVNVTDGPLQLATLTVQAANTGCGTVAGPVASKPKPKPTHSKTPAPKPTTPKPSTPAVVPTASPKSTLAETGSSGTGTEIGVALGALALGAGALVLGRRRSASRHS